MKWTFEETGSFYSYLPRGCRICRQGAGLVLFITGLCHRGCYYCPISSERRGMDVIFADERPVFGLEDIIDEAEKIGALGTGITGGEPMLVKDRVLSAISTLKGEFGEDHNIHLYTGTIPGPEALKQLRQAGLDEIRIHPPLEIWQDPSGLMDSLKDAIEIGINAGVEIPLISPAPGIINAVREAGAFLNLNELEFSETNQASLRSMGLRARNDGCGATGSEEIARACFMVPGLHVHYCSSRFKDAVQLKERFLRRAARVARPFEMVTEDGTILCGTVVPIVIQPVLERLQELGVPEDMYCLKGDTIEIAAWILEEICEELKYLGSIVAVEERYPLTGGLVVERIPL